MSFEEPDAPDSLSGVVEAGRFVIDAAVELVVMDAVVDGLIDMGTDAVIEAVMGFLEDAVMAVVGTTTGPVPEGITKVATMVACVRGAALATPEHMLYAFATVCSVESQFCVD